MRAVVSKQFAKTFQIVNQTFRKLNSIGDNRAHSYFNISARPLVCLVWNIAKYITRFEDPIVSKQDVRTLYPWDLNLWWYYKHKEGSWEQSVRRPTESIVIVNVPYSLKVYGSESMSTFLPLAYFGCIWSMGLRVAHWYIFLDPTRCAGNWTRLEPTRRLAINTHILTRPDASSLTKLIPEINYICETWTQVDSPIIIVVKAVTRSKPTRGMTQPMRSSDVITVNLNLPLILFFLMPKVTYLTLNNFLLNINCFTRQQKNRTCTIQSKTRSMIDLWLHFTV